MKPVVDRLKKRFAGKVEVRRLDANAAETQQLASAFDVEYLPTFVFVTSKGERVDQVVGEISEQDLAAKMSALR
jgi:thiol-disulfide isomerase/thioredoxin